jgi:hypothetical protein
MRTSNREFATSSPGWSCRQTRLTGSRLPKTAAGPWPRSRVRQRLLACLEPSQHARGWARTQPSKRLAGYWQSAWLPARQRRKRTVRCQCAKPRSNSVSRRRRSTECAAMAASHAHGSVGGSSSRLNSWRAINRRCRRQWGHYGTFPSGLCRPGKVLVVFGQMLVVANQR